MDMRLIDADAFLVDSIKEKSFIFYKNDVLNDMFVINTVYADLKKALADAPTVDAIEVIRCKDCILYGPSPYGHPTIGWCRFYGSHRKPEFFCGFAERKEVKG